MHGNILVGYRQDVHPWVNYSKYYKAMQQGGHQGFRYALNRLGTTALDLLKFNDVYRHYLLLLIHSFVYDSNFEIFMSNFLPLIPNHSHKVRKLKIHFPNFRLNVCRQGMVYKCTELINVLPMKFLKPQSDQSLNVNFRQDVLNNY